MSGADTKSLFTMSTVLAIYTSTKICNNIIENLTRSKKLRLEYTKLTTFPFICYNDVLLFLTSSNL